MCYNYNYSYLCGDKQMYSRLEQSELRLIPLPGISHNWRAICYKFLLGSLKLS